MVIMSIETYNKLFLLNDVYVKLAAAEVQAVNGQTLDATSLLNVLREKYNV